MHHSDLNLRLEGTYFLFKIYCELTECSDTPPAALYQFLHEPSLSELRGRTLEPPMKRRKVARTDEIEGIDKENLAKNYITLARVDITLVREVEDTA